MVGKDSRSIFPGKELNSREWNTFTSMLRSAVKPVILKYVRIPFEHSMFIFEIEEDRLALTG